MAVHFIANLIILFENKSVFTILRILFLSGPPGKSPIKEGKLVEASVSEHPELLESESGEVVDDVQIKELNKKEIIDLMEEAGGDPSNLKELSEGNPFYQYIKSISSSTSHRILCDFVIPGF